MPQGKVSGYCPHGCGATLWLVDGKVKCTFICCPDPYAVDAYLHPLPVAKQQVTAAAR